MHGIGLIIILSSLVIEIAVPSSLASSQNAEVMAHIGWSYGLLDLSGVRAAASGSSTDDMVGVFSIQKNIVLAGDNPAALVPESGDTSETDPLQKGRIGPQLLAFDFQPRYINSSSNQPVNFTMILDDQPEGDSTAIMKMSLEPSGIYSGNASGNNTSSATFVSPSHGQSVSVVFTPLNATSGSGVSGTIYQGSLNLPVNSETGIWTLQGLRIYDRLDHGILLDADEVASHGFPTEISIGS